MRINYQILLKQNLQDLNPIFVGESECPPGFEGYANAMANSCVLYRIYRGCGTVRILGTTHKVKAGQFFIIPVGEEGPMVADKENPWFFQWIGFTGTLAQDFLQLPPVFDLPRSITNQLHDLRKPCDNLASRITADLYLLHSTLTKSKPDRTDHVERVVDHITTSYMHKVSVAELANEIGVNACHLSRQFTKKVGHSIQDYLLSVRVFNSKLYLNKGYSVKEAALMCGFNDPNNFTKLFKKKTGYTPTQWKNKLALSEDSVPPYPNRNVDHIKVSKDIEHMRYHRTKKSAEK